MTVDGAADGRWLSAGTKYYFPFKRTECPRLEEDALQTQQQNKGNK